MYRLRLLRPDDPDAFLSQLRQALLHNASPHEVAWDDGGAGQMGLLDHGTASFPVVAAHGEVKLPRDLVELIRTAALHDDPRRHHLAHVLAHAVRQDRAAWRDTLHPVRLQLERMAREVRREIHKMHAFVRFRLVHDETGEQHIAWFEPAHHVVRAAAPFFVRRFAAMRWAILTPRGCAHWDRSVLVHGPPAAREAAPTADDGEALWLAYYRSIFNPARLKPAMMRREMPVRFWKNLPEATQISSMMRTADERTVRMQDSTDGPRRRRRGKSPDQSAADN